MIAIGMIAIGTALLITGYKKREWLIGLIGGSIIGACFITTLALSYQMHQQMPNMTTAINTNNDSLYNVAVGHFNASGFFDPFAKQLPQTLKEYNAKH